MLLENKADMSGQTSRDIHQAIVELADRGVRFAVASVLSAEGSTPCKSGAKAVIEAGKIIQGTIGGGRVEAEAQRLAVKSIHSGKPVLFDFELHGGDAAGNSPICGGKMRVLVDPTASSHRGVYAEAAASLEQRARGLLLTTVRSSENIDVSVRHLAEETIGRETDFPGADALRSVIQDEQARQFASDACSGSQRLEVLVEPIIPKPVLLILGGGHVGQAVARQAALVGFEIAVIDDRPEFTSRERYPEGVKTWCGSIPDQIQRLQLGSDTYIVVVTRGHRQDAEALAACLSLPAAYMGMIGSRRKVRLLREELLATGRATAEQFDRVYAPIGLDIQAVTVPEIATSIVAQLIAVRRGGSAPRIPR